MAALVIAAAGSAIGGSLITGTVLGLSGASIGYFAGSLLASALIKGPNSQGPRLGDLRVQGTEYGAPIPWVAGGPRIAGQIAWASDRREIANTQKVGKGGGGKVTMFTYEVDLLILLTENQIPGVSRIWSNGEMIYNGPAKEGVWGGITIYTGAPDQLPDPIYEAAVGAGNAPAYRGRGYVVIKELQLGGSGQIPNLTFEVGTSSSALELGPFVSAGSFDAGAGRLSVGPLHPNGVGSYMMSAGRWTNTYATSAVDVYSYSTATQAFTLENTFNVGSPLENHSSGTADSPWRVSITGTSFGVVAYSLPTGTRYYISNPYATSFAASTAGFCIFSGAIYFWRITDSFSIYKASLNSTNPAAPAAIEATSAPISSILHVVELGGLLYGLMGSPATLHVYNASDLTLNRVISTPLTFGGSCGLGVVDGSIVITGLSSSSDYQVFQLLGDDSFRLVGNATLAQTGNPGPSYSFVSIPGSIAVAKAVGTRGLSVTVAPILASSASSIGTVDVDAAVSDLLIRAGYSPDEYDVLGLGSITKPVRGMALGQVAATRGALETLQTGYFFEPSKSDKIYLRPRSTTPVADIPFADLGTAADAVSDAEPLALTVGSELELPAQVSLSYNNTAGDYNVATEHSDRMLSSQQSNQVVQLGLGMLPAEAKGVADALLVDQLASLTRTTLRLPLKYAFLEPGDVFTVTNADGREYRLRSTTKRDTLTIIEHECVVDDAGALTSAAITSSEYTSSEAIAKIAPTIWEAMDIPMLRDADNAAGFYVAMAPDRAAPTDEWPGAVFARSWGGDAFDQLVTTSQPATMGACTTTLGNFAGGSGRFDEANTLTVRVTGQLANTTRADMLDDISINAALVGNEIIRFRLAELLGTVDGENEYRLSGLVRGQRGTEQHIGTHGAGERFVLLTPALRRVVNQTGEVGVASQVKAVTVNTLLSSVTAKPFVDTGVSLKPFSVANLRALKTNAGTVLTWQRRTRLDYRYGGTTGVSVPLGEASELYRVDVFSASNFVSTRTVSSPAFTYSSAQLAADGLLNDTGISFAVRQVSASVGPGFPSTVGTPAPDFSTIPSTPLAPTTPPTPGVPTDPGVGGGGGGAPVLSRQSVWPFGKAGSTGLAVRYAEYGSLKTWRVLESANNGASFTPLAGDANVPLTSYPSGRACRSDGVYVSVQREDVENPRVSTVTVVRGAAGSAPVRTGKVFSRGNMPIGVACDGTKFLIFAEGNQMWSSTDGINWTLSGAVSGLPSIASSVFAAQSQSNPLGSFGSNYSGAYFGYYAGRWFLHIFNTLYYNTSATPLAGWTPCVLPSVTAPNEAQFGSNYRIAEVGGALFARGILYNGSPNDFLTKAIERWILKSTDSGATWTTVFTFPGFGAGAYVSLAGSRLVSVGNDFASTSYVSDDSGATWAASANGQTYVGTAYPEVMGANIVMQTVQGRDTFGYNNDVLVYSTNGVAFTNSTYI